MRTGAHSQDTKDRIAQAKMKPVYIYQDGCLVYEAISVDEAAGYLKTYRKKIYRAIAYSRRVVFPGGIYSMSFADKFPIEI